MAFIADAIVSKVIEELTTIAINELKLEVKLVVGVKDEVKNLAKNLSAVQAVLVDAERKQLKDSSIGIWLDDLKDISYEMDDVLDEWWSAILIKSLDQVNNHPNASSSHARWKVCIFIPSCCKSVGEIRLRHDIARKIKDLSERLELISLRKNMYGLIPNVGVGVGGVGIGTRIQERTTISHVNKENVKGRIRETGDLIKLLTSANCSELAVPLVVSVLGMGGLGKTTLAQLAYNDNKVEEHFKERIWVCVSDPFDETRVAKAILESLEGREVGDSLLESMVQKIKNKIAGKKFLLVLDDVWNEDPNKWESVNAALKCGSPGSRVLVTTRKQRVSMIMGCANSNQIKLLPLSKKECWDIISSEVGPSIKKEELVHLKRIGDEIAEKCQGLPLAAKALGGILRFRRSRAEWQAVLDCEMWQLGAEEAEIGENLFASLWLSYHDLSPAERQCLSYCACFPKDTRFRKDDLIKLWMAQGYLKEGKTKDMAMVAEDYFGNMCARSFFQEFEWEKYEDGKIESFKMHDLVHDFVLFISTKECLCIEASNLERLDSVDEAVSHLFVFLNSSKHKFPSSGFSFKRLRSLAVYDCGELDLNILLKGLGSLRSLVLINCNLKEIPSIIGRLIHLRLLDLHNNTELRELPETTSDLCNLTIVDLRRCSKVKRMPHGIGKLCHLRYLYTDDECPVLLTQGIGRIKALREVSFLVHGPADANSDATSLANLKDMVHLKSVRITLRGNVKNMVAGAKQANLSNKKKLVNLKLCFELEMIQEKADRKKYEELIEALQPCSNLEKLEIIGYQGINLNPSWLRSLNDLTRLELISWRNCSNLPPLGELPSLTFLRIKSVKVKRVGPEFLGRGIGNDDEKSAASVLMAFPKLKWLTFDQLQEWEEWHMDESDLAIMPHLIDLVFVDCKKLKALPDVLLKRKLKIVIRGASVLHEHNPEFGRTKLKRRKAYRRRIQ